MVKNSEIARLLFAEQKALRSSIRRYPYFNPAYKALAETFLAPELESAAADRSCRVIVVTGAGRGFCAGVDLSGYGQAPGNDGTETLGIKQVFGVKIRLSNKEDRLRAGMSADVVFPNVK